MTRRNQIFFFAAIMAMLAGMVRAQVPTGNIAAGVYSLNSDQFVRDTDMVAQGNVTIRGNGRLYVQNNAGRPSLTVKGITFDGVQLILDRASGMNANLLVDGNTFVGGSAITWNVGLANGKITNNTFIGEAKGGYSIYGLNYNGLVIANNLLRDVRSGIHADAIGSGNNLLVEQNVVDGYCGIAFEFQSAANNVVVQDNYCLNPNDKYGYQHVGGYSLILSRSSNIKILRNTLRSPNKTIPVYDFEIGGDNSLSSDNLADGGNHVFVNNDAEGTTTTTVTGNRIANFGKDISLSFPATGRTLNQSNNGPGVLLSWDANRAMPGPFKRLGTVTPPTPAPTTNLADYAALKSDRDRLKASLIGNAARMLEDAGK